MKPIDVLKRAVAELATIKLLAKPFEQAGIKELLKKLSESESDFPDRKLSLGWAAVLYKMAGIAVVASMAEGFTDKSGVAHVDECIKANAENLATAIDNVLFDS